MSCPACGCKTTYIYNDGDEFDIDNELMRCAACGYIFDPEDGSHDDDGPE